MTPADREPTLIRDPDRAGIWRAYLLPNGDVHGTAWEDARARDTLIGTCRACGSYLRPGRPYKAGAATWYPATCIQPQCRYETAAHGPRPAEKKRGKP